MADSNSDKQSIDISQEIKNIILSLSENDYTEEEAYAVRNYKDCLKSRNNSLEKFEILKSNNSDFYDIKPWHLRKSRCGANHSAQLAETSEID